MIKIQISESAEQEFTGAFRSIQKTAHTVNVYNGWWEKRCLSLLALNESNIDGIPDQTLALLGLVTSEVAEAMEAVRKHPREAWTDATTKDTFVRECAGAVVRLMDLCDFLDAPLGEAIIAEIRHNHTRGFRHGGKAA